MQPVSHRTGPISTLHIASGERSEAQSRFDEPDTPHRSPPSVFDFDPQRQAEVAAALHRYVRFGEEAEAGGRRIELPLNNQRALEAYAGTRRDEEKAFLHESLGIDIHA